MWRFPAALMIVIGWAGCGKDGFRQSWAPDHSAVDFDLEVAVGDLGGFWELTPSSRRDLAALVGELPPPDPESGTIPMSSDEVGNLTCMIAFGYSYEGHASDLMTGVMDMFPLGYGAGVSTRFTFSWELNVSKPLPETMFSPRHEPIGEAKQWLDLRYFPQPGMIAYQRIYILKRGEHLRLQRSFGLERADRRIVLEWRRVGESGSTKSRPDDLRGECHPRRRIGDACHSQ